MFAAAARLRRAIGIPGPLTSLDRNTASGAVVPGVLYDRKRFIITGSRGNRSSRFMDLGERVGSVEPLKGRYDE